MKSVSIKITFVAVLFFAAVFSYGAYQLGVKVGKHSSIESSLATRLASAHLLQTLDMVIRANRAIAVGDVRETEVVMDAQMAEVLRPLMVDVEQNHNLGLVTQLCLRKSTVEEISSRHAKRMKTDGRKGDDGYVANTFDAYIQMLATRCQMQTSG